MALLQQAEQAETQEQKEKLLRRAAKRRREKSTRGNTSAERREATAAKQHVRRARQAMLLSRPLPEHLQGKEYYSRGHGRYTMSKKFFHPDERNKWTANAVADLKKEQLRLPGYDINGTFIGQVPDKVEAFQRDPDEIARIVEETAIERTLPGSP